MPCNVCRMFEPRKALDYRQLNDPGIVKGLFTTVTVINEIKKLDGSVGKQTLNVLPKATSSLKVLAELPIIVVLMYQLYKQSVHSEVAEFIPYIMVTITLQPPVEVRTSSSFDREIFVDFMAAQIKTLSFLAYIVRLYQDQVNASSDQLTTGMLTLLKLCPQEVAHLRKELLIAARHILATDLRMKFVPVIDQLFDESTVIGTGWTAHESLRPLAYSTVADLVHHVRQVIPLKHLQMAVDVFSKNVHDESLPTSIQTMSCKLLLNLVDCLKVKVDEGPMARDLLIRMLEVFVLKFKSVAELQIPALAARQTNPSGSSLSSSQVSIIPTIQSGQQLDAKQQEDLKAAVSFPSMDDSAPVSNASTPRKGFPDSIAPSQKSSKDEYIPTGGVKFGFPPSPTLNYSIADCRGLVKTLVCGVKAITWGIPSCKAPGIDMSTLPLNAKIFQPKETVVFIRLVKYAMRALDIYMLSAGVTPGSSPGTLTAPVTGTQSTCHAFCSIQGGKRSLRTLRWCLPNPQSTNLSRNLLHHD